jgi:hypothetical protein
MGKHSGKRSPATIAALAVFFLVVGGCILWVAGVEGEAAMKWLDWILDQF